MWGQFWQLTCCAGLFFPLLLYIAETISSFRNYLIIMKYIAIIMRNETTRLANSCALSLPWRLLFENYNHQFQSLASCLSLVLACNLARHSEQLGLWGRWRQNHLQSVDLIAFLLFKYLMSISRQFDEVWYMDTWSLWSRLSNICHCNSHGNSDISLIWVNCFNKDKQFWPDLLKKWTNSVIEIAKL